MGVDASALIQAASAAMDAPKRKPGPRSAVDVPKKGRITPLVREACNVLIDGQAKTITEAAQLVGCSREHLSIMLRKPHVEDYLARERKRRVLGPVTTTRAAHVFASLLDSESDKIKLEASDRILTADGVLPNAKGGGTRVGVNVAVTAGYVIKLRGKVEDDDAPTINATAEVIES